MSTAATLGINIVANTAGLSAGMKKGAAEVAGFQSKLTSMKGSLGGLSGAALRVGGVLGAAFGFRAMIAEAANAEAVNAQLAAVLRSTGEAAGYSIGQLDAMATSLSKTTAFEDEAIKSGQAVLLTFTEIRGAEFSGATQAILDMSTALGGDLQKSAIQVGKALNDPTKGFRALQKAGVSFSESQQATIKSMQAAGDIAGAQKIILGELAKEFGGSAAAAAGTFTGQMNQLKNEAGNVAEALGNLLLPFLTASVSFLKAMAENRHALAAIGIAIGAVVVGLAVYKIAMVATTVAQIFMTATIPFVGIIAVGAALLAAAAATGVYLATMKDTAAASTEVKTKAEEEAAARRKATIAAAEQAEAYEKLLTSTQSSGDATIRDAKDKVKSQGMGTGEKAAFDYQKQAIEDLLKKKADFDKLDKAQQANLLREIGLRAKIVSQLAVQYEKQQQTIDADKAVADALKDRDQVGMKDYEKQAADLRSKGLNGQADLIEQYGKEKEGLEAMQDMLKKAAEAEKDRKEQALADGKAYWEDTLTQAEQYQKKLMDIKALEDVGAIDKTAAARAKQAAFFDNRSATLAQNSPVAALERGSSEEIAARFASRNDPLSSLDATASKQLEELMNQSAIARETKDLLMAGAKPPSPVSIGG